MRTPLAVTLCVALGAAGSACGEWDSNCGHVDCGPNSTCKEAGGGTVMCGCLAGYEMMLQPCVSNCGYGQWSCVRSDPCWEDRNCCSPHATCRAGACSCPGGDGHSCPVPGSPSWARLGADLPFAGGSCATMALVDGAPLVVTGQLGGAQGGVLRTWRWTGALFAELATHPWAGAAGFDASGPADCPALLLPADGVPLLAWTDLPGCGATAPCGLARVARLSGPGWQLQGTAPGGYSGDRFALDESGAVFCAGCCPPASAGSPLPPGTPGLCRFSGGNWTPVAAPVTPLSPFYLSWDFQLAGPPITLSSEGTLFRWSGSAWGMLTRGPSGKGIAVEPGGAVVAIGGGAYDPSPPYLPRLSADRWAGDWSPLGSAPPTIFSFLRFATDGAETWVASSRPRPTFASAAAPLGGDVRVVRSSGGAWEYVGDPLPAVCNAATFQVEALALGAGKAAVLLKDSGSGDLQVWGIDR